MQLNKLADRMLDMRMYQEKAKGKAKGKKVAEANPYAVYKRGDKFVVVAKDTGSVKGTHATKAKALRQFRALEMAYHKTGK